MSWWGRIKAVFKREASDVREGLSDLGSKLDEGLAKKECELNATPSERVEMTLEDIEADSDRFSELEQRIRDETGAADAQDEVR